MECSKCGLKAGPELFYVKYKERPALRRSDWSSQCVSCIKLAKKSFYTRNSKAINRKNSERRYANLARAHEQEAKRRLLKAKDPDAILRRRTVVSLDPTARYLHDRCVNWKASARRRKIEWSINDAIIRKLWERQNGLCWYTKRPMLLEPNKPQTVSLDRLNSSLGYSEDNVVLCETVINKMKLDTTLIEFRILIEILHMNLSQNQSVSGAD